MFLEETKHTGVCIIKTNRRILPHVMCFLDHLYIFEVHGIYNIAILCLLRLEIKSDCRKIEAVSCLESGSTKPVCMVRQIYEVRRDHTSEYRTLVRNCVE